MKTVSYAALLVVGFVGLGSSSYAGELSIYEVQYTEDPNGVSPYNGQIIACTGGVCVGKFPGSRPRIVLQEPEYPDSWGGIQVKDWTGTELFDNVAVGDWVALNNVLVEEYRGTTFLQWDALYESQYTIVSEGNPLPPYVEVLVSQIPSRGDPCVHKQFSIIFIHTRNHQQLSYYLQPLCHIL